MATKKSAAVTEAAPAQTPPVETWTVNGFLVKDLDPAVQAGIFYAMTDQAIAEKQAAKEAARGDRAPLPKVEFIRGEFENVLGRMEDDLDFDPYKECLAPLRAARPDLDFRMLSPTACTKRGRRGWEPCVDEKGDQIKVGHMFAGAMPKEKAQARQRRYRKLAEEAVQHASEEYTEKQEKIIRDGNGKGLGVLRADEMVQDYRDPARVIRSGLSSEFGQ